MAFAGGYAAFSSSLKSAVEHTEKKDEEHQLMRIILFVSLAFQWASLLFINSVFMQYYIPINWLYALFSAYFIHNLINQIKIVKILQTVFTACLLILLIFLLKSSIQGNLARSRMADDPIVKEVTGFWQMIPKDSPAYPNVIFRKPIYPLLWGQVISENVRDRYPQAYLAIEKYKLKILTGLTDDFISYLDPQTQAYILANYQRDQSDNRIWRRIKN